MEAIFLYVNGKTLVVNHGDYIARLNGNYLIFWSNEFNRLIDISLDNQKGMNKP
jgi:spore coat protein CotH